MKPIPASPYGARSWRVAARTFGATVVGALALAMSPPARAAPDIPWWEIGPHYVLGMGIAYGPEYPGARHSAFKERLILAFTVGKLHFSSSGASAIQGFAARSTEPGVSADLLNRGRIRVGLGLRVDAGRNSDGFADLAGLPDIKRTVRGRLSATYTLDEQWKLSADVSQDLLGRNGGGEYGLNLNYVRMLTDKTSLFAGVGVSLGDGQYMRTHFGVSPDGSASSGLQVYSAGAGLKDVHLSIGTMTALSSRWVAYATGGVSTLLGDAADSPMTRKPTAASVSFGLAYRCCK
jgi:outer membrane scaffolding protein for murein synthesis (MipA/OmpV family)